MFWRCLFEDKSLKNRQTLKIKSQRKEIIGATNTHLWSKTIPKQKKDSYVVVLYFMDVKSDSSPKGLSKISLHWKLIYDVHQKIQRKQLTWYGRGSSLEEKTRKAENNLA